MSDVFYEIINDVDVHNKTLGRANVFKTSSFPIRNACVWVSKTCRHGTAVIIIAKVVLSRCAETPRRTCLAFLREAVLNHFLVLPCATCMLMLIYSYYNNESYTFLRNVVTGTFVSHAKMHSKAARVYTTRHIDNVSLLFDNNGKHTPRYLSRSCQELITLFSCRNVNVIRIQISKIKQTFIFF